LPFDEVNIATATVEQDVRKAVTKHGDDKNLFVLTYDEAMLYSKSYREFIEKYPQVGESIKVLFKQNRSLGRHAGGVLLCDDLMKKMPLITSKGEPQTCWVEGVSAKHLEKVGNFVKYDILGLETLRIVEKTIETMLKRTGIVEISLDGSLHRLPSNVYVKLESGQWVLASELTEESDVMIPLETKNA
jgi:DNA polymerase III alpha subunit